jgi:hypothetical protein
MHSALLREARDVMRRNQRLLDRIDASDPGPLPDVWIRATEAAPHRGARGEWRRMAEHESDEHDEDETLRRMAEAGLPLTVSVPEPKPSADVLTPSDELALMREAGVPLKEGAAQTVDFSELSTVEQLAVIEDIAAQRADELTDLTRLPWKADAEILRESIDDWRAAFGGSAEPVTGIQAMREAGLPETDLDDGEREDFDDLDDDEDEDDELESASSLNSGDKKRRKRSSAREVNADRDAHEPEEDPGSLNDPTGVCANQRDSKPSRTRVAAGSIAASCRRPLRGRTTLIR